MLRLQQLMNDGAERDKVGKMNKMAAKFTEAAKMAGFKSNIENHSSYLLKLSEDQAAGAYTRPLFSST